MPFPLAKPNADTPVTEAENIGYGNSNVKVELDKLNANTDKETIGSESNTFYVVDSTGNVVCKIDANGVSTVDVKVKKNGNLTSVLSLITNKVDKIQGKGLSTNDFTDEFKNKISEIIRNEDFYDDEFYICDANGYVAFKVDSDGNTSYNGSGGGGGGGGSIPTYPNSLTGCEFYSLGDSLSSSSRWQQKLAALSGATFNQNANQGFNGIAPLSVGGTQSLGISSDCGQGRVKTLVDNYPTAKVVIYENVNDLNRILYGHSGLITDVPYFLTGFIDYPTVYNSIADLKAAFTNDFNTIVGSLTPAVGAMLRLKYKTTGHRLTISSISGIQQGSFTISTWNGQYTYTISVEANDTIASIINKIVEYDYKLLIDTPNIDGVSVDFVKATGNDTNISITNNTSGITFSVDNEVADANGVFGYCFVSRDVSDWTDSNCWKQYDEVSLYSIYKGIVEYLQDNMANDAIQIIASFPQMSINPSLYQRDDGSFDMEKYMSQNTDATRSPELRAIQKEVAKWYNIKYVDINEYLNISPINYLNFYPSGNVHPTNTGYDRFGEAFAKLI